MGEVLQRHRPPQLDARVPARESSLTGQGPAARTGGATGLRPRPAFGRCPVRPDLRPDGLVLAFTYGIDELRTLRVTRQATSYEAEVVTRSTTCGPDVAQASIKSQPVRRGHRRRRGGPARARPGRDLRLGRRLQHRVRSAATRSASRSRSCTWTAASSATAASWPRSSSAATRVLRRCRFESRNGAGYYTPEGTPLRKAFLRSPLKFSAHQLRLHPRAASIRCSGRAAAPRASTTRRRPGRRSCAAGDGVVTLAGWLGGYGKTVRIRHPNGYETLYGHLSRIDVRAGQRVDPGRRSSAGGHDRAGHRPSPRLPHDRRTASSSIPSSVTSRRAEPILRRRARAVRGRRWRQLAFLGTSAPAATAPLGRPPPASALATWPVPDRSKHPLAPARLRAAQPSASA